MASRIAGLKHVNSLVNLRANLLIIVYFWKSKLFFFLQILLIRANSVTGNRKALLLRVFLINLEFIALFKL